MKKVNKFTLVFAIVCLFSFPQFAYAQDNDNGHSNNGNDNNWRNGNNENGYGNGNSGSSSVPIDGGLSILAIAGVVYTAKKAKELKNNKAIM